MNNHDAARLVCFGLCLLMAMAFAGDSNGEAPDDLERPDRRPSVASFAAGDIGYEVLLHWKNRRKWDTAASIGDPVHGLLPGGVVLEREGEHHAILRRCRRRETHFGTPRLLELVRDTAEVVHTRMPGPRLMVGNMSVEGGGPMRWSKSHGAGRDVDLAFFVKRDGVPVEPDALSIFDLSTTLVTETATWTFDTPRNWALVKALLSHPTVDVQWIFVSNVLRRALLAHAEMLSEPRDLLVRARSVLRQPGESMPHNDHFHVRIFCEPGERLHGCRDKAPVWPWVARRDPKLALRAAAISLALRDESIIMRTNALERIETRRLYEASSALVETALMDPSTELQNRAMVLLTEWKRRDAEVVFVLERFLRASGEGFSVDDPAMSNTRATPSPEVFEGRFQPWVVGEGQAREESHIRRAYMLLGRLGAPESVPFLVEALSSKRMLARTPEALLAAWATRHVMSVSLVPALMDALEHDHSALREAAARSLQRITNHTFSSNWGSQAQERHLAPNIQKWRDWWRLREGTTREKLLIEGFSRHDAGITALRGDETIGRLVHLMKKRDPVAYNADRALTLLTGRRSALDTSADRKRWHWTEWIEDTE